MEREKVISGNSMHWIVDGILMCKQLATGPGCGCTRAVSRSNWRCDELRALWLFFLCAIRNAPCIMAACTGDDVLFFRVNVGGFSPDPSHFKAPKSSYSGFSPDPSLDVQRAKLQQRHIDDDLLTAVDGNIHPLGIHSGNCRPAPRGRAAPQGPTCKEEKGT